VGRGSDREVQWVMGGAGVIGRRREWWARQGISGEVYGPRCRVRDAGVIRGKTIKINIGLKHIYLYEVRKNKLKNLYIEIKIDI